MTAQIKGQAHAAEFGDFLGAAHILLLAATPSMDEEDAGQGGFGGSKRAGNGLVANIDLYDVAAH
ncbi:hypothetical protein GCM10016234_20490 [Tianweitania populi]|uniref:Uncharacterized protein n=1 Tax=Tianweitania populi TaxID=1607949 RepID=A0A8J3DYY6_9HYPH|nr:hypothetical protein GCM10016234_20490 [Tianweitania populi]